jgi:RHS repeat-associated protein
MSTHSFVQWSRRRRARRGLCGQFAGRFRKMLSARSTSYPLYVQHHRQKSRTSSEDPFGNLLAQSGALAEANLYRFSSKEHHPTSGLVYYLYRFYDPGLQRWVNRDPIADQGAVLMLTHRYSRYVRAVGRKAEPNLYGFVRNDPTLNLDPDGREILNYCQTPDGEWTCKSPIEGSDSCLAALYQVWERAIPGANGWWGAPPDDDDRFEHCRSSCELARTCGRAVARGLAYVKEGIDWLWGPEGGRAFSNPGYRGDMQANAHGRNGVNCPKQSCDDYCRSTRDQYPPADR